MKSEDKKKSVEEADICTMSLQVTFNPTLTDAEKIASLLSNQMSRISEPFTRNGIFRLDSFYPIAKELKALVLMSDPKGEVTQVLLVPDHEYNASKVSVMASALSLGVVPVEVVDCPTGVHVQKALERQQEDTELEFIKLKNGTEVYVGAYVHFGGDDHEVVEIEDLDVAILRIDNTPVRVEMLKLSPPKSDPSKRRKRVTRGNEDPKA